MARGLTQSELADSRFSKQYVSQLERDQLRPTGETLAWLAERLQIDQSYLATGVDGRQRERVESLVVRAEAAVEAHDYAKAIELLGEIDSPFPGDSAADLELRALLAESWARMYIGEMREALPLLSRAREIVEDSVFSDVDRAEVLFRLGCCRYRLTSVSTALALFTEALELAERSGIPCDRLRSRIFGWRSRCYRRQRDWEAALEDVERALELAEALDDPRGTADAYFLGALVAERRGQWVAARSYAEKAKALYEQIDDRANTGKLLTTLGGLTFLLGKPDESIPFFKQAFAVALEVGSDADAAQAVSSLAQVHLRTGQVELAEEQARHALELLAGQGRLHRRDRERAARARTLAPRAGQAGGGGREVRSGRDELRPALLRQPQGRRVDGPGRARGRAWGPRCGDQPVPARGAGVAGLPLLKGGASS